MTKKILQILLLAAAFLFIPNAVTLSSFAQERKAGRIERKADRRFIRQNFDKAMKLYEEAVQREATDLESSVALHLKMARLYFMLREYVPASEHFAEVMRNNAAVMTVSDVCDYVDALRFQGKDREAEAICLNHAYKDVYRRYQRYQNTLNALSMRYAIQEDPGFSVYRLALNTDNPEFWVGSYGKQPLYAISYSRFNDPNKLFFHQTHYYPLNETGEPGTKPQRAPKYSNYLRNIPADLQNGALSFSPDLRMMVTTVIEYNRMKTSMDLISRDARPFHTKLYYSILKNDKRKFSKYQPVFLQDPAYSYAHPCVFNDGKSLLFTSDMPGGYGGFDLYMIHWNENTRSWGTPLNLGPDVNTEGDELFPVLYEGRLLFASNGLPGYGGYDIFSTFWDAEGGKAQGGMTHLPYPVNSVFNDYSLYPTGLRTAYFISDRNMTSKDDVYFLRMAEDLGTHQEAPFYGMSEEKAISGGTLLLNGNVEDVVSQSVSLKSHAPEGKIMSIYFDFDSDKLTPESITLLERFVSEMGDYDFTRLRLDGYADEVGGERYNYELSARRANVVQDFLRRNGINVPFEIEAHGRLKLSPEEIKAEVQSYRWTEGMIDWTQVNRKARRVDIYNKR